MPRSHYGLRDQSRLRQPLNPQWGGIERSGRAAGAWLEGRQADVHGPWALEEDWQCIIDQTASCVPLMHLRLALRLPGSKPSTSKAPMATLMQVLSVTAPARPRPLASVLTGAKLWILLMDYNYTNTNWSITTILGILKSSTLSPSPFGPSAHVYRTDSQWSGNWAFVWNLMRQKKLLWLRQLQRITLRARHCLSHCSHILY